MSVPSAKTPATMPTVTSARPAGPTSAETNASNTRSTRSSPAQTRGRSAGSRCLERRRRALRPCGPGRLGTTRVRLERIDIAEDDPAEYVRERCADERDGQGRDDERDLGPSPSEASTTDAHEGLRDRDRDRDHDRADDGSPEDRASGRAPAAVTGRPASPTAEHGDSEGPAVDPARRGRRPRGRRAAQPPARRRLQERVELARSDPAETISTPSSPRASGPTVPSDDRPDVERGAAHVVGVRVSRSKLAPISRRAMGADRRRGAAGRRGSERAARSVLVVDSVGSPGDGDGPARAAGLGHAADPGSGPAASRNSPIRPTSTLPPDSTTATRSPSRIGIRPRARRRGPPHPPARGPASAARARTAAQPGSSGRRAARCRRGSAGTSPASSHPRTAHRGRRRRCRLDRHDLVAFDRLRHGVGASGSTP